MAATDISQLDAEYLALTERCGLLDRSERGKLALTGPGAKAFLAGQVTNDTESLASGTGCYAAFLTSKGKMLGDMRILDLGEELFLDTERVALQALFDMIRRFKIGYEVELHKRTLECSLLSLIGPFSGPVATLALDHNRQADLVQPKGLGLPEIEHSHREDHIAGCPVRIVATDRWGIDVICAAADRDSVWDGLRENGAHVVDGQTAEIVRIERGRPRYGIDLDDTTIPQEAGLNERAVSFTKGCYVGQETVARLYYRGKPNRHLRGLRMSASVAPGAELRLGERSIGRLSSSALSPVHGPIGLALVRREAEPGSTVSVGEHGASAEVIEPPFQPR